MERLVFILEIIGTIAFALSGVMVGIEKKMDIFGVTVMAIVTSVGGGILRDVILGDTPPMTFRNPIYVEIAIGCAIVTFVSSYKNIYFAESKMKWFFDKSIIIMDAIGLGVFTAVGTDRAYSRGFGDDIFLLLFVGILTGVGGGVLRDMLAQKTPLIFLKQIYACASLVGAIICVLVEPVSRQLGMCMGTMIIIVIRLLAVNYHWNLPKIR